MTPTLLFVDDSDHDLLAYRRALRDTGYAIETAQTLAAGLAMAAECRPAMILLDYNLPDGHGLEFIRRLGELEIGEMPVTVMLTGSGDEEVAVAAMKSGISDYLIKDMAGGHLKLLPTVIARALRERAQQQTRREAENKLLLAANVYHNITEGVVATTPDGTIVLVNPSFCAMTGHASEDLIGANPRIIKSNRHEAAFYQDQWTRINRDGCWQGEIWNRRKDGSLFLARETITAIRDDGGRLQHYVAVLTDITEARQAEEFLIRQAYHDALTGLPNRSLFTDRLRHQIAYGQRQKTAMGVLFIDLDGFKDVNDACGHEIGDELLKMAAARLRVCVRESDTVARLGGDEFTAIVNDLENDNAAAHVAQKMLDQMSKPFPIGQHELNISASIGIAIFPRNGDTAAGLLKSADDAMYQAKRAGKACYAIA